MNKIKIRFVLLFSLLSATVAILNCSKEDSPESVVISQITCDKSTVTVIDTVKLECVVTSSGTLHYHWSLKKDNTVYESNIIDRENISGSFDFGTWLKWNPPSSGTWTIEVLAYLSSADHSDYGSGSWENYFEYDIYGNLVRLHCFNLAEKGELWDKKNITITVDNYSKFSFTKHIIESNLSWAQGVYTIDLDGDGDTDILGTAEQDNVIAWWENLGSRNFSKHVIDNNFQSPTSVCAKDMDDDGDIDVIGSGDYFDNAWWENDGSNNFTRHNIGYNGAEEICVVDLDSDDDIDIVGALQMESEIVWWENNGSFVFTEHTIENDFNFASSVYTEDINNDGHEDIIGAAEYGKELAWWENNGDKLFTKHIVDNNSSWPSSVVAIDLDGDTDIDLIAGEVLSTGDGIVYYENDGSNSFTKYSIDDNYDWVSSVYAIDMDNDGDVDVVATVNDNEISWWENKGSKNFLKSLIEPNFQSANFIHAADIDGDGDVDVIGTARFGSEICWWESKMIQ